jgi:potassium-dependent mechanosensitive channel
MTLNEFLTQIREFLDSRLFGIGDTNVTIASVLTVLIIVIATIWGARIARRASRRVMLGRGINDEGTVGSISSLVNYIVLFIGFAIAMRTIGIDLDALFAAGAIFAIALGFALQGIVQNFVAGVILLTERNVRPADVLEIEGLIVRVAELGLRSTIVRTRDGEDLIVPNSVLIQDTVKNYTLRDSTFRLRTEVGVNYDSDMQLVRQVLEEIAKEPQWNLPDVEPQVLLLGFGDNAVLFEVAVWMADPWLARQAHSDLNEAIWWKLKERGIVIAFPQLDVHFDAELERSLGGFSKSAGA